MRDLLRAQPVLHADETPARVDGGFKYVHVACTGDYTVFARSRISPAAVGVKPQVR